MGKILLCAFYFPPAGGGGVQRGLKLAQQLPAFGIETHVLTPEDSKWIHSDDEDVGIVRRDLGSHSRDLSGRDLERSRGAWPRDRQAPSALCYAYRTLNGRACANARSRFRPHPS